MSKQMNVQICFSFLFNNTGYEWHELQGAACDFMSGEVLHCVSKVFSKTPDFNFTPDDAQHVSFYIRHNNCHIEIIALAID